MPSVDPTRADLNCSARYAERMEPISADILLADDDPHLREVVRYALAREGFSVREVSDGAAALDAFRLREPDLVVLDVLMPEADGIAVCRAIRGVSTVPILMLSSRGEEVDRLLGLELGADDYVTKPFSTRELVTRVRALLRRSAWQGRDARDPEVRALGPVRVHLGRATCHVGENEVGLTLTELRMLAALLDRPGHVLTRDALVERAYGGPHHVSDRTLDSHVRNIRAKLREAGSDSVIETVHGLGFRARVP
jgi:two-component system OmpR family response regulator